MATVAQVGIYKTDNATKSLAINPGEFVVGQAKDHPATALGGNRAGLQVPLQTRDSNVQT